MSSKSNQNDEQKSNFYQEFFISVSSMSVSVQNANAKSRSWRGMFTFEVFSDVYAYPTEHLCFRKAKELSFWIFLEDNYIIKFNLSSNYLNLLSNM